MYGLAKPLVRVYRDLMTDLFCIGAGGFLGAISRYLVSSWIYRLAGSSFPYGTLFVNVAGSFILCAFLPLSLHAFNVAPELRAAVTVGFCGAFTTFSTFSFETISMLQEGSAFSALLNVGYNIILCLAAGWLGFVVSRLFIGSGG